VSADEFVAISRYMAAELGIDMFDECSFIPNQLMYWPTCPSNGEYICKFFDGNLLDPDTILAAHPNWQDCSLLPTTSRESKVSKPSQKPQEDPLVKSGVVGAFCRAYSITAAIDKFLSDTYAPSVAEGRYDYISGESTAGVVVYDDKFAYSHHATDPACGKLLNAFDLVRIHKFGVDDEKKSFSAMSKFAIKDELVNAMLLREKQESAAAEFDDWAKGLQRDRGGQLQNNLHNITLILENDENLKASASTSLLTAWKSKAPSRGSILRGFGVTLTTHNSSVISMPTMVAFRSETIRLASPRLWTIALTTQFWNILHSCRRGTAESAPKPSSSIISALMTTRIPARSPGKHSAAQFHVFNIRASNSITSPY
jgi:hypothetical protein